MPHRPPNLRAAFRKEKFTRVTKRRPLLRLYRVRAAALHEIPLLQQRPYSDAAGSGERLVFWFGPNDLAERTEAELIGAFRAVLKRLRREAAARLSPDALEVYRLQVLQRPKVSYARIAERFASRWPDCTDVDSRVRRAKRYVAQVKDRLGRADKRAQAALTARERAILATVEPAPDESFDN